VSFITLKNETEIEALRAAGQLVSQAIAEVAPLVRPGVTSGHLDQVAESFIRDHGAEPAFKGYTVGRAVYPATLCVSVDDVVVHGIPGNEELREGQIVTIDCGVILDGFYGDSAYTFAVGEISDELRELCATTYEALNLAVAAAVPGGRIGDISAAVQKHCEAKGYGVVRDLVGHGIGRSLHEAPQVPNFGRSGVGRKLKPGLTMCIEPMVNLGTPDVETDDDMWTIRTADGKASAHYEHMVAITSGQADVLTTFEFIEEQVQAPYRQAV
jgi:methionyl aminopeptidase